MEKPAYSPSALFATARCHVRPFEEGDLDDFMAYRNNGSWMRHQGFKGLSKKAYRDALLPAQSMERGAQLAVVSSGTGLLIGDLYLKQEGNAMWIGYTVAPQHARQGYAYEAVQGALEWLRKQGHSDIRAGVLPENSASIHLLEKLGFAPLGQEGGELVYALKHQPLSVR